ncbi:MAG: SU10 major capsid protein [Phycisphaerales bacterium]
MAFTGKASYSAGTDLPELVEDVSDIIGIVSPHETPLLDHLGDAKRAAMSTVHEWIEDALLPNRGRIDQGSFSPDPQTAGTITVDDVGVFRVGDLIRPGDSGEVALVGAVLPGSSEIVIARGYGATTAATLTDDMELTIIGNAALEGADAPEARFTNRVRRSNYTQIFTAGIDVSGSLQASRAYGVADEVDYQKQERMRELLRDLENCVINGVAPSSNPQGNGTVRRSMNGILHSIATNRFEPGTGAIPDGDGSGSDELNEAVLNAALRSIWENSSCGVDTIVVGGAQKRKINSFATSSRAYLPDDQVYSDMIGVYESDFGVCRVVMSRWAPSDKVLLLDSSRISVMPMQGRSFQYKPLAATGDSISGQVLGEYTLEFKNENAHGVISGLAV